MEAFWSSQEFILSDILWLPGPHLQNPTYRWAPRNLLHPDTLRGSLQSNRPLAVQTAAGLKVQDLPAVKLHNAWTPKDETSLFSFAVRETDVAYYVWKQKFEAQVEWRTLRLQDRAGLCILLSKELTSDGWVSGILLSDCRDVDGSRHANWLTLVVVYQEGGTYDSSMALSNRAPANRDAWAEHLSCQETWIIS